MIEFTVETEIACSPAEVFAYATDPAKLATWQTNTISAIAEDDLPVGLGTRLREVHRAPGGKQLASLVEVSEYEPDRVFGLRMLEGALPIHARITFEKHGHKLVPGNLPCVRGESRSSSHGRLAPPDCGKDRGEPVAIDAVAPRTNRSWRRARRNPTRCPALLRAPRRAYRRF